MNTRGQQTIGLGAGERMKKASSIQGFTLIEVMIVVAVIGILAAIAYPSYQESVTKTRRSAAQGCLVEMAQFMERFYTTNMRYDQTAAGVAVALANPTCRASTGCCATAPISTPASASSRKRCWAASSS